MPDRPRRIAPELLVAALAVASALYVAGRAYRDGFPLDDAWIHLQYGLELRRTGLLAYNDGIASTGCTSPLWAVVCALAHFLAGASGPSMAAAAWTKTLGIALHATTAVLAARLVRACVARRRWSTPAALGAGAIVATSPVLAFAAVSGMEVALTSALLLGAALASMRARHWLAGAMVGLATIARPECIVMVPAIAIVVASRGRGRAAWAGAAKSLGAAAIPIAALLARNLYVSRLPLPATFYAKANPEAQSLAHALRVGFVDVLGHASPTSRVTFWIFVVAAVVLGAIAIARRVSKRGRPSQTHGRPLALAVFALASLVYVAGVAAITVVENPTSFYYERYFAPPLAFLVVGAVCASVAITARAARAVATRARVLVVVLPAVAFAFAIVDDVTHLGAERARYASDVAGINALQVAVGKYIHDHVSPTGVVWTVDAGAIRYFGERRTVDLVRLNTREIFHGSKVPKEWWPEAIAVIPEIFQTATPPDLMDVAFVATSSSARDEAQRKRWRQEVYVCRSTAYEHPDNRVIVLFYGSEIVAVGRCAPK